MRPPSILCAALSAALVLPAAAPACADSFVLVHGAWQGEWAWDAVTPLLEAEGHAVTAVALKGLGSRAGESSPEIGVEDHIADILAAIEGAAPPVILVAFSYGGRPATGAWDRARDRVAHAVWVEAPAPLADAGLRADDRSLAFVVMMYPDLADSGMMPPPPTARAEPGRPLSPMPLKALYGAVPLAAPLPGDTPATYVYAEGSSLPALRQLGEALSERRGWALRPVPGGHDVPTEAPEALAAILLEVAAATD
jgi:pimeloyl-ACP methyl ester carboxylesterase